MASRPRKHRVLLLVLLGAIICMPLIFWALMAWQEPVEDHGPFWYVGTWQAPQGKAGNQITFQPPADSPEQAMGATGAATFTNYFETGAVEVTWKVIDTDPLVLHFSAGATTGIAPYAALRPIDDHNMQIGFTGDEKQARSPGFLDGATAQIMIRWP